MFAFRSSLFAFSRTIRFTLEEDDRFGEGFEGLGRSEVLGAFGAVVGHFAFDDAPNAPSTSDRPNPSNPSPKRSSSSKVNRIVREKAKSEE
ncbi:MAG: hypothetical protein ACF8R7_04530, partial [Phycisphaerales bacterium JB039]